MPFRQRHGPEERCQLYPELGDTELNLSDVSDLTTADLPGNADMGWASFPCQDLSLAGSGAGLRGERSGAFWPFWNLIAALADEDRAPPIIVLENVCGALTSHGGKDFSMIGTALVEGGYRFGALVIDAVHFVPQSRPRLFVLAISRDRSIPEGLVSVEPDEKWRTSALVAAHEQLSRKARENWLWWCLPMPMRRTAVFADLIEENPRGVKWHTASETRKLLGMMSPVNLAKVVAARNTGQWTVGAIYKRTRSNGNGVKTQRAEIRFDDLAGCLRTPVGGSSRQIIMIVEGKKVRSRLLSPREATRLMGLPDGYKLPENYNEAYHLAGDGVVVPVIRHIAEHILEPILFISGVARNKAGRTYAD